MPFSWYHADLQEHPAATKDRARLMYEREIAERAALLLRLGFNADETRQRVRKTVAWDFELHNDPKHLERVDAIVDEVYARRGVGAGAPSL